jgi:hypothetical protein
VIEQQSFIDPLTEIYNRRSLDEIVGARCVICRFAEHLVEWNAAHHVKDLTLGLSIGGAEWHDGQTLEEEGALYLRLGLREQEWSQQSTSLRCCLR